MRDDGWGRRGPGRPRRFSPREASALRQRYEAGLTVRALAEAEACSMSAVRTALQCSGALMRGPGRQRGTRPGPMRNSLAGSRLGEIRRLLRQGKTMTEIAQRFDVTRQAIFYIVRRYLSA